MKQQKRVSIRIKLLFIFGSLLIASLFLLSSLSVFLSRKAVVEKINTHLIDKSQDTAEIIKAISIVILSTALSSIFPL